MIRQIISKTKNNNYEKVNPYNFIMQQGISTTFIDVNKFTIGVGNSNQRVENMGIQELLDNAKMK
jgi:hypothetical protein